MTDLGISDAALLDTLAIGQLSGRYALALDGLLPDAARLWTETFVPDGRMMIVNADGSVVVEATGHAQLARLWEHLPDIAVTRHWFGQPLVSVRGDLADMAVYCMAMMIAQMPPAIARTGIYRDRMTKADGRWRFLERILTLDPGSTLPAVPVRPDRPSATTQNQA